MRTIRELLTIVRDELNSYEDEFGGLCSFTFKLCIEDKITRKEYFILSSYLDDNIPFTLNTLRDRIITLSWSNPIIGFWWKEDAKQPRIKWLNKHIKKLS